MVLSAYASPLLPVTAWSPHRVWDEKGLSRSEFLLSAFTSSWVRSLDLTLRIPEWPEKPDAHVRVAIPSKDKPQVFAPVTSSTGDVGLTVSCIRWNHPDWTDSPGLSISLNYTGTYERDVRIEDDLG